MTRKDILTHSLPRILLSHLIDGLDIPLQLCIQCIQLIVDNLVLQSSTLGLWRNCERFDDAVKLYATNVGKTIYNKYENLGLCLNKLKKVTTIL